MNHNHPNVTDVVMFTIVLVAIGLFLMKFAGCTKHEIPMDETDPHQLINRPVSKNIAIGKDVKFGDGRTGSQNIFLDSMQKAHCIHEPVRYSVWMHSKNKYGINYIASCCLCNKQYFSEATESGRKNKEGEDGK